MAARLHPLVASILEYLAWSESNETDLWAKDDVRTAWITVRFAERGYPEPYVLACQQVFGCHPDRLQLRLDQRRRAQLGSLYSSFYPSAAEISDLSPKKPPQKVTDPNWRRKKAS